MKNVFFSAGRSEIKPWFSFSLFELFVPADWSYCMDTVDLPFVQLLSNCLQWKFFLSLTTFKFLNGYLVNILLQRNAHGSQVRLYRCSAEIFPEPYWQLRILTVTAVCFLTLYKALSDIISLALLSSTADRRDWNTSWAFLCYNLCQQSCWMDKEAHLCLAWLIVVALPSRLL